MSTSVKPHFKFKQFSIWQDQCAMKVSTDGILLGAWAPINEEVKTVLDIGTGTGLLALMLAQRLADLNAQKKTTDLSTGSPDYKITSVELDCAAAEQAKFNVQQSPWADRIDVIQSDIKEYAPANQQKADLIVCNPPYFTNALHGKSEKRNKARHNDSLPFKDLAQIVSQRLAQNGQFHLILPVDEAQLFCQQANNCHLHLTKQVDILASPNKAVSRIMMSFALKTPESVNKSVVIVRDSDNHFHNTFNDLCWPFYLKIPDK